MATYLITEDGKRINTEDSRNIILERNRVVVGNILVLAIVGEPAVLSTTAWSTNLGVLNVENATSYPEFHIRGPGNLFAIENHTTKQGIYFNNFRLGIGDYLIIRVDPINGLSFYGVENAMDYLSPISDTELSLSPGINRVSLSFELNRELIYGDEILENFLVNGLGPENTDNGELFIVDQRDPGDGSNLVITFRDYENEILAEGYVPVGEEMTCYLDAVDGSGVSGNITTVNAWSSGNARAEFAIGLANVVWKNRRWSIDEEI